MPKRKSPDSAEPDGMVVLHRSSFIEWRPSPIVALASSRDGSLNVAVREDGDVELYETSTLQRLQRVPGHVDAAPTCAAVVDQPGNDTPNRVFVAGLDGNIVELDLENSRLAAITDSYGGAVWQLAVEPPPFDPSTGGADAPQPPPVPEAPETAAPAAENLEKGGSSSSDEEEEGEKAGAASGASTRVAVACDDGCVRLFLVESGVPGAAYLKSLPRVEGRTLALAWHPSGKAIVSAGSDGCIHAWDVATGRETLRITAGDSSGKELCVWSLLVLPDGTIVAGDSTGGVSFWEGRFGTLVSRFNQHHADVLQLAASPDGATVFAAGVDPRIAVYHRSPKRIAAAEKNLSSEGPSSSAAPTASPVTVPDWVYLGAKRTHTHDVRALSVAAGKAAGEKKAQLLSGGNDAVLFSHSVDLFLKEHPRKVTPCPQRPVIQAAANPENGAAGSAVSAASAGGKETPHCLMAAARNCVDLWQLGRPYGDAAAAAAAAAKSSNRGGAQEGDRVEAEALPTHLAQLVNRSGDSLAAATVSKDGRFLAYSDTRSVRCFSLSPGDPSASSDDDAPRLLRGSCLPHIAVKPIELPEDLPAATHLFFLPPNATSDGSPTPASCALAAVAGDGVIRVLGPSPREEIENGEEESGGWQVQTVIRELHDLRYKMWVKRDRMKSVARRAVPSVELAATSPDGRWLAAALRGRVHLLPLDTDSSHKHKIVASISTPSAGELSSPLSALGFTPDGSTLVLVTASNLVAAYQVPSGAPTEWTAKNPPETLPKRLLTLPGPVVGVAPSPAGRTAVLLYSHDAVCYVDFGAPMPAEQAPAKRKREKRKKEEAREATPAGQNCRALYCEDPVLYVEALGEGEMVVVERSWADVQAAMAAPPMYRHRYGT